jgi:hypothetical protein
MAQIGAKILMASSALVGTFFMVLPWCNKLYAKYVPSQYPYGVTLVWRRVLLFESIGAILLAPAVLYMLTGTPLPFKAIAGK